jgi:hypothetical protein
MSFTGKFLLTTVTAIFATGAAAQDSLPRERTLQGIGHLFTNDFLGDGKDRWRTGSFTISPIWGRGWNGRLPDRFGSIIEFRARGEIIAPNNLARPNPDDRRWAGTSTFGLHTHFALAGAEVRLGGDLAIVGPQTGLDDFQDFAHDVMDQTDPGVFGNQIGNGVFPTISGEMGRDVALTGAIRLRPFVEAAAGVETFVRVGGDLVIGSYGKNALLLRDTTTGLRYSAITLDRPEGISLILGGDIARMEHSEYLDDSELKDTRKRLRAGLHWGAGWGEIFYGATWLSEEFVGQKDDQIVGSIKVDLRF